MASRETIVKRPSGTSKKASLSDVEKFLTAPCLEYGYLQKLNSRGSWQKRWWELRGPYLMYWDSEKASKPKKKGLDGVSLPLAAIDLRRIVSAKASGQELILKSKSGSQYSLRAAAGVDMIDWERAVLSSMPTPEEEPSFPPVVEPATEAEGAAVAENDEEVPTSPGDAEVLVEEERDTEERLTKMSETEAIEQMLAQLREDKDAVNKIMLQLPPALAADFQEASFADACGAGFDRVDIDGNGELSPEELFPVVGKLAGTSQVSITLDHCRRFVAIFDLDGNGVITRDEFANFSRTMMVVGYIVQQIQLQEEADRRLAEEGRLIDEMLENIRDDRNFVNKIMLDLPPDLAARFQAASFAAACGDQFASVDTDGNGVLTPDELFPVIQDLSGADDLAVTMAHCIKFAEIFDADGNGVITRNEFAEFAKTMMVVAFVVQQQQQRKQALVEGMSVDRMIDQIREDRDAVNQLMLQLPPDLAAKFQAASFAAACGQQFDRCDTDGNGILTLDEIYPVILDLSGVSDFSVTLEHCARFAELFDFDGDGVISRSEFAEFAKTMMVVGFIVQQQAQAAMDAQAVDELIQQVRDDKEAVDHMLQAMPKEFAAQFIQASWAAACGDAFDRVDKDGNGSLSPEELHPLVVELAGVDSYAVTKDHCRKFAALFDADGNGVITRDEFAEFAKTMLVAGFILQKQREAVIAEEEALEQHDEDALTVEGMITQLREDRAAVGTIMLQLPEDLAAKFQAASFAAACGDSFDRVDSDGNGVLTPDELLPVIADLSGVDDFAVTMDHCIQFAEIFDKDKNGVISRDEFADFARTMMVVSFVLSHQEEVGAAVSGPGAGAPTAASIAQEEGRAIDDMINQIEEDRAAVGKIMEQLPPELAAKFTAASFAAACGDSFDSADTDGNGVLTLDELFPIILELSGAHDFSITMEHCSKFAKVFDADKNGVISREEFADFARTMMVVGFVLAQSATNGSGGGAVAKRPSLTFTPSLSLPSVSAPAIASKKKNALAPPERVEKPEQGKVNDPSKKPLHVGAKLGKERDTRRRSSITARKCFAPGSTVLHRRDSPYSHDYADLDPSRNAVRDSASEEDETVNLQIELALDHTTLGPDCFNLGEQLLTDLPRELQTSFDPFEAYQLKQQFSLLASGNRDGVIGPDQIIAAAKDIGDLMTEDKITLDWAMEIISEVTEGGAAAISFPAYCKAVNDLRRGYGQDRATLEKRAAILSSGSQPDDEAEWAGKQAEGENAFTALRDARARKFDLPKLEGWILKRGDAFAVGMMNSWKVRYFRQEFDELVYYAKEPSQRTAESSMAAVDDGTDGGAAEETKPSLSEGTPTERVTDDNIKGSINLGEIVRIDVSLKTKVPSGAAKTFFLASGHPAEDMCVFKVTNSNSRRFVLAVPSSQLVPWVVAFEKHVEYARAALVFRRKYGSGVPQGLTLEERIEIAKQTPQGRVAMQIAQTTYENQSVQNFLKSASTMDIIPGTGINGKRIMQGYKAGKRAMDLYTKVQYSQFEATFGVRWQYFNDVKDCPICEYKFPSMAFRIEQAKHHCRMCGRVICHSCSSTMLYYEVSGKRERTCSDCIRNGGPPEHCKSDPESQVSTMDVIKQEASSQAKSAAGDTLGVSSGQVAGMGAAAKLAGSKMKGLKMPGSKE